jgi:hypothetical protein
MRMPSFSASLADLTRRLRRLRGTLGTAGLALALVAGQGGALLHELSHYSASTSTNPATNPPGRADAGGTQTPAPDQPGKACDLCLAFAQLAGALHSSTFASPLIADLRDVAAHFDAPVVVAAATLAPRSRGPPALL